jgi:hypothetical protein
MVEGQGWFLGIHAFANYVKWLSSSGRRCVPFLGEYQEQAIATRKSKKLFQPTDRPVNCLETMLAASSCRSRRLRCSGYVLSLVHARHR